MDKLLSGHFDLESPEYYPEDIHGAAPGDGIIYIFSDDEMESASVDDLDSLSDDDELALLAECIERQMELPTAPESISLSGDDNPYITGCLICGKSVEQIQAEAVIDYLHKTAFRGESPEHYNARRLAFLEGMEVGCFMLIPGGVSLASACDGNLYSICHDHQKAQPNAILLN